jgi:hypothetical protein
MMMIHLYHNTRLIVVITVLGLTGPAHASLVLRPCGPLGATPAAPPHAAICVANAAAGLAALATARPQSALSRFARFQAIDDRMAAFVAALNSIQRPIRVALGPSLV